VFDPEAANNARKAFPALTYVANAEAAMAQADVVLHLTEWPEFADIDPCRARALTRGHVLVDGRNKLDHRRWRQAGWTVHGLGRGTPPHPSPSPVPAEVDLRAVGVDARPTAPHHRVRAGRLEPRWT
jgi:UDPglucose 6-dehydrogenase